MLDGEGVLELHERDGTPSTRSAPGSVIARPPGTGVAHAFRAGADAALTLLAYGQHDPRDTCFYPASQGPRCACSGLASAALQGRAGEE